MPDVISLQPADVRMFVALDVHKLSIVAATLLAITVYSAPLHVPWVR
jgi:hypothetical protein